MAVPLSSVLLIDRYTVFSKNEDLISTEYLRKWVWYNSELVDKPDAQIKIPSLEDQERIICEFACLDQNRKNANQKIADLKQRLNEIKNAENELLKEIRQ